MVVLGHGSYGIVLSNPRLPIISESFDEVINLNQVSKILYDVTIKDDKKIYIPNSLKDFDCEYTNVIKLSKDYDQIFNSEYFILPIKAGIIDKKEFINKFNNNDKNYNFEWLSKSITNVKIFNELLQNPNNIYQIIYEKGEKISSDINIFMSGIKNIFDIIKISNEKGFFFDDLKLENLIFHECKIKMIDFSCPINTNLIYDNIKKQLVNSKYKYIYYFPYDCLINIILYENINQINLIGDTCFIGNNYDYCSLLNSNAVEYDSNVKYKMKQIERILYLEKNYFKDYYIEIKVINCDVINKIKSFEDIDINSEIKKINLVDFSSSILQLLLYYNKSENNYDDEISVNKINTSNQKVDELCNNQNLQIEYVMKNLNKLESSVKSNKN